MFKYYLTLVETKDWANKHLWIGCTKETAKHLMSRGPTNENTFYDSGALAKSRFEEKNEDIDPIVLEFKINPDVKPQDIRFGDHIVVHNPDAVEFIRVWYGVVDDAFSDDIKKQDGQLDEFAIGGIRRCTAVTANALLKHFGKTGITLSQVPETDVGVLEILTQGGLAYKPFPMATGRTLLQFGNLNRHGAWFIVTKGHALALIAKELFDAENRGLDGRKIIQAYTISRR